MSRQVLLALLILATMAAGGVIALLLHWAFKRTVCQECPHQPHAAGRCFGYSTVETQSGDVLLRCLCRGNQA